MATDNHIFDLDDRVTRMPVSCNRYEQAAEPKELYAVPGAGQVDLYDKTELIPFDELEEFFTKNLA